MPQLFQYGPPADKRIGQSVKTCFPIRSYSAATTYAEQQAIILEFLAPKSAFVMPDSVGDAHSSKQFVPLVGITFVFPTVEKPAKIVIAVDLHDFSVIQALLA